MINIFAIILAGGSGTRFWPLSRETCPKQMLRIVGEDTLLRQTIKRIAGLVSPKNIWIVTTQDKAQDMRFHIESLGSMAKEIQFIKEPIGKNTAPAIGLAAIHLNHLSLDSIMIVMPSDHAIPDTEKFMSDLRLAIRGAMEDYLVTFGIKPTRPETGYGYIKINQALRIALDGLFKVERFTEKPDSRTAKEYLSEGNYFWNSGIFVWKTSKILSEIEMHLPNLHKTLQEIESLLFDPHKPDRPDKPDERHARWTELYASLENISVDYGVMERSRDVLMVPATFRWSDLGNWAALDEVIEKDDAGNIMKGNVIDIGSCDSTIFAGDRLIATLGLKDMVVVDTPDATLVVPKERVQEIRKIVEVLKKNGREEHLLHKTVERPWGSYTVLEKGQGYKIKRVVLNPKARLSLQLHRRRSEHWVVVGGTARVTRGDETYLVRTNESTYIPINAKHRLENLGDEPLQIIEVQNGEYLEEDDIERFEDDYGR
ncbi:MAG: mannose-1-phosphate guanylyltransferase/mannose-6-phosphate isomerase [Syntrophaceae bacterium]|nr:mannose-1-phosphate guanylyltransferase/mannose-6-phosphate isomerase [Syntrophaceae bacterium]